MNKNKIIVTIGLQASGKTTWAKKYCEENEHVVNICKDDLRKQNPSWKEKQIIKERNRLTHEYLGCFHSVIWSDTGFNPIHLETAKQIAKEYGAEVEIKDFTHVPLQECIKRNLKRPIENRVDSSVIYETYAKYLMPSEKINLEGKAPCVVFDLDGTLAHMKNRGPFDWNKVGEDSLDVAVATMFRLYKYYSNLKIFIVSGRDGSCYKQTCDWLEKYGLIPDRIYMRAKGDMRDDTIVKGEFADEIEKTHFIQCVYDDRPKVCWMWKGRGTKVINCAGQSNILF